MRTRVRVLLFLELGMKLDRQGLGVPGGKPIRMAHFTTYPYFLNFNGISTCHPMRKPRVLGMLDGYHLARKHWVWCHVESIWARNWAPDKSTSAFN